MFSEHGLKSCTSTTQIIVRTTFVLFFKENVKCVQYFSTSARFPPTIGQQKTKLFSRISVASLTLGSLLPTCTLSAAMERIERDLSSSSRSLCTSLRASQARAARRMYPAAVSSRTCRETLRGGSHALSMDPLGCVNVAIKTTITWALSAVYELQRGRSAARAYDE